MNGLDKKTLKIGLGGVAAVLLMAGGQASAAPCGATIPIATVLTPGFTCTLGDSTFSNFTATNAGSAAVVEFAPVNPVRDAVTLSRDGGTFASGTVTFNFTETETGGAQLIEASVGIDVATVAPATSTVTRFNGMATSPSPLMNSQTGMVMFSPSVTSVVTDNTITIPSGAFVSSITDVFSQTVEAPEPASLSLFGLGLLGLGFARRRRS